MRKRLHDNDKPVGTMTLVADFLPAPDKLAVPEETVKVTISLKKSSVDFFKRAAHEHHTKYQRMLRELIDRYATQYTT